MGRSSDSVKNPSAALHCALRHCGVLKIRLTPQGLRALHLELFTKPLVERLTSPPGRGETKGET